MAYTKDVNQKGVLKGMVRYRFDTRILGKRKRRKETCFPSAVQQHYRQWIKKVEEETDGNYMFFEILDQYRIYVKDHKTEKSYRNESRSISIFKDFFKDMYLKDFRRFHVEDFIPWRREHSLDDRVKQVSPATINRDIACLSCFFTYCITRDYYSGNNPTYKIKLKENNERAIDLTDEQISEIFEKAQEQLYTVLVLALYAGLRKGEICGLKWIDIDFDNSVINLPPQITKGNKRRTVTMPDFLIEYLLQVRRKSPSSKSVVMDKWQTVSKLDIEWNKLRKSLSFEYLPNGLRIRFHDLRHVYAQKLRDTGVPLGDIKELLGHSSVGITEKRYAQLGSKDMKEKVNRLSNQIQYKKVV